MFEDVKGFVKKKKSSSIARIFGNTNQRWLEINFREKVFGYKESHSTKFLKIFKFSDLIDFSEKTTVYDKKLCDWEYGFELIFKEGSMTLYCATSSEHGKWVKGFKNVQILNSNKFSPVKTKKEEQIEENPKIITNSNSNLNSNNRSKSTPIKLEEKEKKDNDKDEEIIVQVKEETVKLKEDLEKKQGNPKVFSVEENQVSSGLPKNFTALKKTSSNELKKRTNSSNNPNNSRDYSGVLNSSMNIQKAGIVLTTNQNNTSVNLNQETEPNAKPTLNKNAIVNEHSPITETFLVSLEPQKHKKTSSALNALKKEAQQYSNIQFANENFSKTIWENLEHNKEIKIEDFQTENVKKEIKLKESKENEIKLKNGVELLDWNYYDEENKIARPKIYRNKSESSHQFLENKQKSQIINQKINLNTNLVDVSNHIKKLVQIEPMLIPEKKTEFKAFKVNNNPGQKINYSEMKEFINDEDCYKVLISKIPNNRNAKKSDLSKSVTVVGNRVKGQYEVKKENQERDQFKVIFSKNHHQNPQIPPKENKFFEEKINYDEIFDKNKEINISPIKKRKEIKETEETLLVSEANIEHYEILARELNEKLDKLENPNIDLNKLKDKIKIEKGLKPVPVIKSLVVEIEEVDEMKAKKDTRISVKTGKIHQTTDQSKIFENEMMFARNFLQEEKSVVENGLVKKEENKAQENGENLGNRQVTFEPSSTNQDEKVSQKGVLLDYSFREGQNMFVVEIEEDKKINFKTLSSVNCLTIAKHNLLPTLDAVRNVKLEEPNQIVIVSESEEIVCVYNEYVNDKEYKNKSDGILK